MFEMRQASMLKMRGEQSRDGEEMPRLCWKERQQIDGLGLDGSGLIV